MMKKRKTANRLSVWVFSEILRRSLTLQIWRHRSFQGRSRDPNQCSPSSNPVWSALALQRDPILSLSYHLALPWFWRRISPYPFRYAHSALTTCSYSATFVILFHFDWIWIVCIQTSSVAIASSNFRLLCLFFRWIERMATWSSSCRHFLIFYLCRETSLDLWISHAFTMMMKAASWSTARGALDYLDIHSISAFQTSSSFSGRARESYSVFSDSGTSPCFSSEHADDVSWRIAPSTLKYAH